ncbi:MAG: hypothetical protein ACREA2_14185 [Blastocatellia bacterium]
MKAPIQFKQLEVISLRRFENNWRAELKGDLQGIIQAMAAGMASAAEEKEKGNSAAPAEGKRTSRKP